MYVNQPFWSVDTMFYTEMKQANVAKVCISLCKIQGSSLYEFGINSAKHDNSNPECLGT